MTREVIPPKVYTAYKRVKMYELLYLNSVDQASRDRIARSYFAAQDELVTYLDWTVPKRLSAHQRAIINEIVDINQLVAERKNVLKRTESL